MNADAWMDKQINMQHILSAAMTSVQQPQKLGRCADMRMTYRIYQQEYHDAMSTFHSFSQQCVAGLFGGLFR